MVFGFVNWKKSWLIQQNQQIDAKSHNIHTTLSLQIFSHQHLDSKFRKLIEGKMFVSQSWRHTICQGVWDQFYIAFLWMSNCISIFQASRQNLITILVSLYSQYLILLKDLNLLEGILNIVSKTDLNNNWIS